MVAGKNILELGVGTGPNFKYYANETGINVIGVDPNKQMEDYARTAAVSAGLPSSNFTFRRGVSVLSLVPCYSIVNRVFLLV
jgi:cyclopropane fatty-acyl-phospholipid synthase-like methyltransferase